MKVKQVKYSKKWFPKLKVFICKCKNNASNELIYYLICRSPINIVVVSCGDRFQETLTMLKSAIMMSNAQIKFVIITEDDLIENFNEKVC